MTAPVIPIPLGETAVSDRYSWVATVDHKRVGILYLWTSLFFFVVSGCEALLVRLQLAVPRSQLLTPHAFNQIFTMHGTTMIFLVVMPVLTGAANYFVPLMIGARDVAFPRLNAMAYWLFPFSGFMLHFSWLAGGAPDIGWFSYAPLSETPFTGIAPGASYWAMALLLLGVSSITSSINLIATTLSLRAPGMTMRRVPLFVWMVFVNSILTILALPALTASCVLLLADRLFSAQLFLPSAGGSAILWQHYFWSFGHPEVYIMVLPAFGMISEIIPVFARKPIFGYAFVAASTVAIAVLSFGVWAHHMFAVGMGRVPDAIFGASSLLIAVPTGVKIFNWIATMWGGAIRLKTAMLFAVAFLLQFVLGGLSGITFAVVPIDWQTTDTYYVVAHFHYVLFGGTAFAVVGAIYYWFPKMTGRLLSERMGRLNFWLMVLGFNLTFFVQHFLGLLGMPRRVYTYPDLPHWAALNMASTVGAFILGAGALVLVANIMASLRSGAVAGNNPWNAWTLEWSTSSPPPEHNFDALPPVHNRRPLWDVAHPEAPDAPVGPDEPSPPPRHPVAQVAIVAFIASEAAFFTLLIIAYVFYTATSHGGPSPHKTLDPARTGVLTALLVSSSVTFWRAEKSHAADRHRRSIVWLAATIALGVAFLVGQVSEYMRLLRHGIRVETNLFTTTFFTLTGFHGMHVMAGLLALRDRPDARDARAVARAHGRGFARRRLLLALRRRRLDRRLLRRLLAGDRVTTRQLLLDAWIWRPVIALTLTAALGLHVARFRLAHPARTAALLGAGVAVVIALMSPIAALARGTLFSAHMLQHMLLMLVVPPLVLLAVPRAAGKHAAGRGVGWPPVAAWGSGVGAMWLWHAPTLCNLAATNDGVRALQTISLLAMGAAFWWPILGPRLDQRLSEPAAIAYLATACAACTVLGDGDHVLARRGLLGVRALGGPARRAHARSRELGTHPAGGPAARRSLDVDSGCTLYAAVILALVGRFYRAPHRPVPEVS